MKDVLFLSFEAKGKSTIDFFSNCSLRFSLYILMSDIFDSISAVTPHMNLDVRVFEENFLNIEPKYSKARLINDQKLKLHKISQ